MLALFQAARVHLGLSVWICQTALNTPAVYSAPKAFKWVKTLITVRVTFALVWRLRLCV